METLALLLGLWGIVFQVMLARGWPAAATAGAFSVVAGLVAGRAVVSAVCGVLRAGPGQRRFLTRCAVLAASLGALFLSAARPDADDVGYVGGYLRDLRGAGTFQPNPFLVPFGGSIREVPGLAAEDAYEALVVASSTAFGIDPLVAYHDLFPLVAILAWVAVVSLLFRRLRLGRWDATIATLGTAAFLLLDGNLHRSFGNFAFVRMWQGKVIAYSVLLPLFLWASLRFLGRPGPRRFTVLGATAVALLSVNRSMLFMLPVLLFGIAVAWFCGYGRARRAFRELVSTAALLTAVGAIGGYVSWRVLEGQGGLVEVVERLLGGWQDAAGRGGRTWWQAQESLLFGGPEVPIRDLFLLLVVPWFALRPPLRRFLPVSSAAVLAAAFLPWTGGAWFVLASQISWRLYYVLPVPLCAGLAVLLVVRPGRGGRRWTAGFVVGLLAVGSVGIAFEQSTLSRHNGIYWKTPMELRFDPAALDLVREIGPRLAGRTVLAPNAIANVLSLVHPGDPRLVFERRLGSKTESVLGGCRTSKMALASLRRDMEGVDVLVTAPCSPVAARRIEAALAPRVLHEEALSTTPVHPWRVFRVEDAAVLPVRPSPGRSGRAASGSGAGGPRMEGRPLFDAAFETGDVSEWGSSLGVVRKDRPPR